MRKVVEVHQISNGMIAKLNDLAFKAINKGSLNKMIDKRAIKNEDVYKDND
jgi:hypothetical protein